MNERNVIEMFKSHFEILFDKTSSIMGDLMLQGIVRPLEFVGGSVGKFVVEGSYLYESVFQDFSGGLSDINVIDSDTGEIRSFRSVPISNRMCMFLNVILDFSGNMSNVSAILANEIMDHLGEYLKSVRRGDYIPIVNFIQIDATPLYWITINPENLEPEHIQVPPTSQEGRTEIQLVMDLLYKQIYDIQQAEEWEEIKNKLLGMFQSEEARESFEESMEIIERVKHDENTRIKNLLYYTPLVLITDQMTDPLNFEVVPKEVPIILVTYNEKIDGILVEEDTSISALKKKQVINESYQDHETRELWAVILVNPNKIIEQVKDT